jgi:hypothetical protein
MRRLGALTSVLLALLWFPVTSHCLLELAGLIHQDPCCETRSTGASHGHDAADGICQIESSGCALPKTQTSPCAPFPGLLLPDPADVLAGSADPAPSPPANSPPHWLALTWHFSCRAALPPRAPSLLA